MSWTWATPPVRIVNLAETLITLSGLEPYEDIAIKYVGLRPGEKLSEELYFDGESFQPTAYEKLLVLKNEQAVIGMLTRVEAFLIALPGMGQDEVKARLSGLVPEYRPAGGVVAGARNREPGKRLKLHHGSLAVRLKEGAETPLLHFRSMAVVQRWQ